ncbi:LapA family protein [Paracoccus sp. (in: a-proteobacteria)]|uniref:LapA family protein n=1 Tax=Paracoccus sp. TaxID=267 RepID=UPI0026DF504B|nr:LapA family protein [Paracoccus sp. (in: a-proteobacteria)]MDO5646512.1 LapA family protein [Paracoccus sp. (in: a-proteobacteria)]
MRFIRLIFVAVLALLLVGIALANRGAVTLSLFPADFGRFLGGTWAVTLPLFLVVFVAFAAGMLSGLIWEWLREAGIRHQARIRGERVHQLENELGLLRTRHAAPKDEVVAILDAPETAPAAPETGAALPAIR